MLFWVLSLLLVAPLRADPLSQGERDRALSHLHASRKFFLDSVEGLTDAQWKFKPAPETWSIAECAEHIALSEEVLLGFVKKMLTTPAVPTSKEQKAKDEPVLKAVVDRSQKVQAPEMLKPGNKWKTPGEIVAAFRKSREVTLDYVRVTQDNLRDHRAPHPVFEALDAYQWLLLLAAHSERHTLQIREVMAHPQYPR